MTKNIKNYKSQFYSKHTGRLGEEIVCRFLKTTGYTIVEKNYLIRGSEIDIVAEKNGELFFCEVKTSRVTPHFFESSRNVVSHETYPFWEKLTKKKISAMKRAIPSFREKHHMFHETVRLFGFLVSLDVKQKKASIETITDINV